MNTLIKVSQQTVWQLLGKAITALSTIIILGLVSRTFGEDGTGVLTLALTFLSFFVLAADFGVNAHVLPHFLRGDFSLEWKKLLGFRLLLSGALILVASITLFFWPGQTLFKQSALLGLVAILEAGVFATVLVIFQTKLRYDLSALSVGLGTVVTLGMVYILTHAGSGIPALMVGYSAGWIVTGLAALVLVKKYVNNLVPLFDLSYARELVKHCWPISLTLMLNVVYFRLDTFILSFNKGFADVGVYNLSYQIFQSLLVLPTFIMNGFYPLMLKDIAQSKQKFVSNLAKAALLMFTLAVLGTGLTLLLSPWVVGLIAGGKGFFGSTPSLQILSLGFPAFFVSSVLMWALITIKRYKTMLVIYLVGLLVNLVLNLVFIPRYSYVAAAWITGVTEYLILILQISILIPALNQWKK